MKIKTSQNPLKPPEQKYIGYITMSFMVDLKGLLDNCNYAIEPKIYYETSDELLNRVNPQKTHQKQNLQEKTLQQKTHQEQILQEKILQEQIIQEKTRQEQIV
jgi:hypothetical protein